MKVNNKTGLRKNILISFGILIVCLFYGYYMMGNFIWPVNVTHWESGGSDNTQHYIGWLAYRQDNWHWPLTYTNRINNPTGASIVFTDSIPLFAVFGKIFNSLLPENFQYFSLFILLAYILQYGFGFLLLRYFCPNSLLISLLVTTLVIQISEFSPLRASSSISNQNPLLIFPKNSLKEINNIAEYTNTRYFWILPTAYCPGGLGYEDKSLLFVAVKTNLITNEINAARRIPGYYENNCYEIQKLTKIKRLKKDTLYAINKDQVSPDFLLDMNKPENKDKCLSLPKYNWVLCHRKILYSP